MELYLSFMTALHLGRWGLIKPERAFKHPDTFWKSWRCELFDFTRKGKITSSLYQDPFEALSGSFKTLSGFHRDQKTIFVFSHYPG